MFKIFEIFHDLRAGHGRPGTGPPEAPGQSPAIGDPSSTRSTPGRVWEPQNTRSNVIEPSHIEWITQTDPRPKSKKRSIFGQNVQILDSSFRFPLNYRKLLKCMFSSGFKDLTDYVHDLGLKVSKVYLKFGQVSRVDVCWCDIRV